MIGRRTSAECISDRLREETFVCVVMEKSIML